MSRPGLATAANLLEPILAHAGERPEAPALRWFADGAWRDLSWRGLADRVAAVAGGLAAVGIRPGDRVAIVSGNRPEWALADLGGLAAGAIVVGIYPTLPPADTAHPVRDAGARLAFVEDSAQAAKLLQERGRLPDLRRIVVLSGEPPVGCWSLAELEAGAVAGADLPGLAATRSTPAVIAYTSGTTGVPKGVVLSHGNLLAVLAAALEVVGDVSELELILSFLPLAHVLERIGGQYLPLVLGGTIAYARSLDTVAEDLRTVRPDFAMAVPRLFEKIHGRIMAAVATAPRLRHALFDWALRQGTAVSERLEAGRTLPLGLRLKRGLADRLVFRRLRAAFGGRLRLFVSGGAPLDAGIARFFHAVGILVLEGWGATETSAPATLNTPTAYRFGSVGRPIPGVEVRLADDGEFLVRGPTVFAGYWGDRTATAEALHGDGWYATGDIGRVDDDGFVWITDRKREIIITSGGKNIAPQRVERRLRRIPGVSQAAAWGDRHPYLVALLTLDRAELAAARPDLADAVPDEPALLAFLRDGVDAVNASLARYEQVKRFAVVEPDFSLESGELTITQKLRRKVIGERHRATLEALYDRGGDPGGMP